jgi:hypothetical protein
LQTLFLAELSLNVDDLPDQLGGETIYHASQQTGTRSLPDFALESF